MALFRGVLIGVKLQLEGCMGGGNREMQVIIAPELV